MKAGFLLNFPVQVTVVLLWAFSLNPVLAQNELKPGEVSQKQFTYQGFSGGMMIHSGYTWGKSFQVENAAGQTMSMNVSGPVFGIGGRAVVSFGKHWRFGMEGYVSTTHYGEKRQFRLGWGGILAEYQFHIRRFHPFMGVTFGGGGVNNVFTLETPSNGFTSQEMVWRKYGVFIINPSIGTEFAITNSFRLFLKADYILAPSAMIHEPDFTSGIRVFFGVVFCRQAKKR